MLTTKEWVEAALISDGRYTLSDIVGVDESEDECGDLNLKFKMNDGEVFALKLSVMRH